MDWNRFEAITFDCYGTLIDWETGILRALRPLLGHHGRRATDEEILVRYAHHEAEHESGSYRPYRDVLAAVVEDLGRDFGFEPDESEIHALSNSLPNWPAFPDTVDALRRLAGSYRLGILSNVDDDLFAGTARRLGIEFDWVVTAQQVGSYKPARANFEALRARIGLPAGSWVHAAQSLFHDVRPARELGFATVWVDRRGDRPGGATPPADAQPDLRVVGLAELADEALGGGDLSSG